MGDSSDEDAPHSVDSGSVGDDDIVDDNSEGSELTAASDNENENEADDDVGTDDETDNVAATSTVLQEKGLAPIFITEKEKQRTSNIMNIFEFVGVISSRAIAIADGSPVPDFIGEICKKYEITHVENIALIELNLNKEHFPMQVHRKVGGPNIKAQTGDVFEVWDVKDLILPRELLVAVPADAKVEDLGLSGIQDIFNVADNFCKGLFVFPVSQVRTDLRGTCVTITFGKITLQYLLPHVQVNPISIGDRGIFYPPKTRPPSQEELTGCDDVVKVTPDASWRTPVFVGPHEDDLPATTISNCYKKESNERRANMLEDIECIAAAAAKEHDFDDEITPAKFLDALFSKYENQREMCASDPELSGFIGTSRQLLCPSAVLKRDPSKQKILRAREALPPVILLTRLVEMLAHIKAPEKSSRKRGTRQRSTLSALQLENILQVWGKASKERREHAVHLLGAESKDDAKCRLERCEKIYLSLKDLRKLDKRPPCSDECDDCDELVGPQKILPWCLRCGGGWIGNGIHNTLMSYPMVKDVGIEAFIFAILPCGSGIASFERSCTISRSFAAATQAPIDFHLIDGLRESAEIARQTWGLREDTCLDLHKCNFDVSERIVELCEKVFNIVIYEQRFAFTRENYNDEGLVAQFLSKIKCSHWENEELNAQINADISMLVTGLKIREPSGKQCEPSDKQREIILKTCVDIISTKNSRESGMACITGPPGSGKTSVINNIIQVVAARGVKYQLSAPTGKAVSRIRETTKCAREVSSTLHSHFKSWRARYVDLLIIDEGSMVYTQLMAQYLKARGDDPVFILMVGDTDQLPPIMAGEIFALVQRWGLCPVHKLTEVFRTSSADDNEHLLLLFDGIRRGMWLQGSIPADSKAVVFHSTEPDMWMEKLRQILRAEILRLGVDKAAKEIGILTPKNINLKKIHEVARQVFKEFGIVKERVEGTLFSIGERVMMMKNVYPASRHVVIAPPAFNSTHMQQPDNPYAKIARVQDSVSRMHAVDEMQDSSLQPLMNGDVGTVIKAADRGDQMERTAGVIVRFDSGEVQTFRHFEPRRGTDTLVDSYALAEFEAKQDGRPLKRCKTIDGPDKPSVYMPDCHNIQYLVCGFGFTIHKSQGSEYLTTITVCPEADIGHFKHGFVKRSIFYTSATRTRDRGIFLGTCPNDAAYIRAVQRVDANRLGCIIKRMVDINPMLVHVDIVNTDDKYPGCAGSFATEDFYQDQDDISDIDEY